MQVLPKTLVSLPLQLVFAVSLVIGGFQGRSLRSHRPRAAAPAAYAADRC